MEETPKTLQALDWAVMAEFVSRGVDTSDLKPGLDTVSRVEPGGNYLTDPLMMDLVENYKPAVPYNAIHAIRERFAKKYQNK